MPNTKVISVDTLQRFYNNSIKAIQHKGSGTISIGEFYNIGGNISYTANSRLLTDKIFSAKQWWSMDAYPIVNYPIDGNNTACYMINSKMTVDMGGFTMNWADNPLSLLWCFINLPDSFGTYDADIKMYFAFPKDPTQQIEVHLVITAGSLASNTAQVITVGSGGGGGGSTPEYVILGDWDSVQNSYTSASATTIQNAITAGASRFAITLNSSLVLLPTTIGVANADTSMPIIKTLEQIVEGINQSQYVGVILEMRLQFTNTTSSEDARYNVNFVINGGTHAIIQNQCQKLVM